jgi:cation-transporting ATPase 13A2
MERARRPSMSLRRSSSRAHLSYGDDRRYSRDISRSRRNSGNYSDYQYEREDYGDRPSIFRHGSRRSRRSLALSDGEDDYDQGPADPDEVPPSPGLLPRIASAFGFHQNREDDDEEAGNRRRGSRSVRSASRRGSSVSRRASTDAPSSEENWGYSSNEEDTYSESSDRTHDDGSFHSSLADDTSLPPQSRPSSPIPLLPSDGIFGDPSAPNDSIQLDHFNDVSSASKQTILLPDEDLTIRFRGYVTDKLKSFIWLVGCILSLGILGLVGRWIPQFWVRWCGRETDFEQSGDNGWLVVEVCEGIRAGWTLCLISTFARRPSETCTSFLRT